MTKDIRKPKADQTAEAGSRQLKPACSKCRSVVNASKIPSWDITRNEPQSTSPQDLSARAEYILTACSRSAGVMWMNLTGGQPRNRPTLSEKCLLAAVRAKPLPVSATIQSVRKILGFRSPISSHRSLARSCKASSSFRSASQPLVSRKMLLGIGHLGMAVEVVIGVGRQVSNSRWHGQFAHSPDGIELLSGDGARCFGCRWFLLGFDKDCRSVGQVRPQLKHYDAVFDCAFVTHNTLENITETPVLANAI